MKPSRLIAILVVLYVGLFALTSAAFAGGEGRRPERIDRRAPVAILVNVSACPVKIQLDTELLAESLPPNGTTSFYPYLINYRDIEDNVLVVTPAHGSDCYGTETRRIWWRGERGEKVAVSVGGNIHRCDGRRNICAPKPAVSAEEQYSVPVVVPPPAVALPPVEQPTPNTQSVGLNTLKMTVVNRFDHPVTVKYTGKFWGGEQTAILKNGQSSYRTFVGTSDEHALIEVFQGDKRVAASLYIFEPAKSEVVVWEVSPTCFDLRLCG